MKYKTLLKANLKRHKGSLIGIFILMLLLSLALATVLSLWINSQSYIEEEMDRAGFGELTAWVSVVPDTKVLADDIAALGDIKRVETQSLIYSDYSINEQEADSEGQLIKAEPQKIDINSLQMTFRVIVNKCRKLLQVKSMFRPHSFPYSV